MSAASAAAAMFAPGNGTQPDMDASQSHSGISSAHTNQGQAQGGQAAAASTTATSSSTQSGPPYLCPTCQTSYSRLEYLRRHERRHADIRPFVCDCGKGFSRSDVLSRHKRQCAVHLSGGTAEPAGKPGASANGSNAAAVGKKAGTATKRKSNGGAASRPRKSSTKSGSRDDGDDGDESNDASMMQMGAGGYDQQQQHQQQQQHHHQQQQPYMGAYPQQRGGVILPPQPYQHHMPMGSVQQQGSFPFPLQPGMGQGGQNSAPLMPPAPYGSEGSGMSSHNQMGAASGQGPNQSGQQTYGGNGAAGSPFGGSMPHLAAINNFVNQHNAYPSSPESNGTMSQHGSPRFVARDMSRHNSGNSRFSLRKSGGSFDHIGPRQSNMSQSQPQYSADFWDALDPAAKTATTGPNSDYVSASTGTSYPPLSLADGTGAGGISTTPGITGLTTPRGDLQRFAVSAGPLSPFSSIALNSTMSPYLSAFSNARDTPFVASPSRGGIPGTPGSSLNVFDWTMRPPSKPASSTQKRDSVGSAAQALAGGSGVHSSPSGGKRKREDEEASRKSPRIQEKKEEDLDEDHRSAAELLDSLRNSGPRPVQPAASEAGVESTSGAVAPAADAVQKEAGRDASTTIEAEPSSNSSNNTTKNSQSFFDQRNATTDPEAFRLNLQKGAAPQQQNNGAQAGVPGSFPSSSLSLPSTNNIGTAATSAAMMPSASASSMDVPPKTWDAILNSEGWFAGTPKPSSGVSAELASLGDVFPSTGMTPLSAGTLEASTKWLMSPGVQQIINSFAPQPGDFGSYFAGATSAPTAPPVSTNTSLPSLGTTSTPAVSSNLAKTNGPTDSAPKNNAATPSVLTSSQALERALADPKNPFYVSPDLFRACYSVPHWDLPAVTRLSMLALHAQQNLVKHIPIIHEPTFRLDTTPGCIAFALCMLGCHEAGRQWWAGQEVLPREDSKPPEHVQNGDRVAYRSEKGTKLTRSRYDEEDGQILVRPHVMEEKVDMLIRSFASRTTSAKDRVSVVQVVLLYQIVCLISADESTRAKAASAHPQLISLARQAHIFDVQAEHSERHVHFTTEDALRSSVLESHANESTSSQAPKSSEDDEKLWRRWSELAGRRRTAFSIFIMDTITHYDANAPLEVQPSELDHLPLPSPDTIWRAPNVDAWKKILAKYHGPRFGEAMRELLASASPTSILGRHGPFARLSLVAALLRGILHFAETRDVATSPLQAYMPTSESPLSTAEHGALLQKALHRWRVAWDQDDLCLCALGASGRAKLQQIQAKDEDMSVLGSHHLFGSHTASGATALMDDALPLYWVARIALEKRAGVENEDVASQTYLVAQAQAKYGCSAFHGEGAFSANDFRALLRAAKSFIMADEQCNM